MWVGGGDGTLKGTGSLAPTKAGRSTTRVSDQSAASAGKRRKWREYSSAPLSAPQVERRQFGNVMERSSGVLSLSASGSREAGRVRVAVRAAAARRRWEPPPDVLELVLRAALFGKKEPTRSI